MFDHTITTTATTNHRTAGGVEIVGMVRSTAARCSCGQTISGKGGAAVANHAKHVKREQAKEAQQGAAYLPWGQRPKVFTTFVKNPAGGQPIGITAEGTNASTEADRQAALQAAAARKGLTLPPSTW